MAIDPFVAVVVQWVYILGGGGVGGAAAKK